MFIKLIISFIFATSLSLFSDDHSEEQSFPGMVSSDVFDMGGGMEMHVERRKTCNQGTVPKHFHPAAGTLVYVLDGVSQSKSSGIFSTISSISSLLIFDLATRLFTTSASMLTGFTSISAPFLAIVKGDLE